MKKTNRYHLGLVNNIPVLYTYERLKREQIPKDLFVYDIQSLDDGMTPSILAREIKVHHWAAVISKEPLMENDENSLNIKGIFIQTDDYMHLEEYQNTEITNNQQLEMRL